MFESKTGAKRVVFPVVEETAPTPKRPAWLEDARATPLRTLFQSDGDAPTQVPSLVPGEPQAGDASQASRQPPAAAPETRAQTPADKPPAPRTPAVAPPQAAPETVADRPPAPTAEPTRAPEPPPAERPPPAPPEPEVPEHQLEERVWSKLPGPPQLGSLIPGARSAPPPANDTGLELLQEQREAFTNAAIELAIARAATLSVLEGQLLDLSIEIASALIERELERDPELHATLARAALASLGDSERVTLRTSPDAYDAICQTFGGSEPTVRGVHVQVHPDDTIPGLGCIVEGDSVRIDATVAERLRAVRRAFEEERRKVAENSE